MLTLCIDTAYKYLTCALIKDNKIISSYSDMCFKRQSEEVFVILEKIFKEANINKKDIDSICISKGPGSYTGTRIAMTIAKVIGETLNIDVYTISTLRLYASGKSNQLVLMDARANRAYIGMFNENNIVLNDCIKELSEINSEGYEIVGDASLLGKEDVYPDIANAFLMTKSVWEKADNISYLAPEYLKESENYLR